MILEDPKSFGIMGMTERAQQIGGIFTIEGSSSDGTIVTVKLPL